jgi:hypothetical protein
MTSKIREKLLAATAANTAEPVALPSDVVDFPKRGRRLNAKEIAAEYYGGHVGEDWVHSNVTGRTRVSHRVVLWWEYDVLAYLEAERTQTVKQGKSRRFRPTYRNERRRV